MNATPTGRPYLSPESMPAAPEAFVRFGDARATAGAAWIVDPGLAHHRGHHHPLDTLLRATLERLGDRTEVLCHRSFRPEPGFVPCFRHSIYEVRATSPAELDTRLAAHAHAFDADLRQALDERVTRDDLLLFPTAHLSLLVPLHRWLANLPEARRPRTVRLHFHVAPAHGMDGDATRDRANEHFGAALRALVRDQGVRCTADHPQLAAELSVLCGVAVEPLKSPHVVPAGVQRVHRGDGRIRLLFIGEPRAEKGYVAVVQALAGILSRTSRCDVRFVLPVMRDADLAYLRTLPPDRVSVRLEDGLPTQAYFEEIARADHVLCVYDRSRYAAMSSGIAVDAALLDVPIVVTRGTATERAVVDPSRVRVLDDPTAAALVDLCESLDRTSASGGPTDGAFDAADEMRRAARLERDGRGAEAEQVYHAILRCGDRYAPAWHALGLLALSAGHLAQAVEWVEKAALADDAEPLYQRNLCELARRAGRLDKATLAGRRACRLAPDDLDAHYNLGVAYADAGETARAIEAYSKALRIDPGHGLSWNNLGALFERQGDRAQAADAYARAIATDPRHAEAQNNLGALLRTEGRIDEARACFVAALEARPDFPEAGRNLAALDAASTTGAAAVDGTSVDGAGSSDGHHLRGIHLYRDGHLAEALAAYDRSLALNPDAPAVLNSRGFVLQDLDRMDEALACFERAVALAPEFAMARLNLGMAQLKLGHWRAGWDNYEARWTGSAEATNGQMTRPASPLPQWDGQGGTESQRLLVITEQGFGDTFQFARYLALAAERFAKVGFVCSGPTQRLMEWACGDRVVFMTRMPSDFDAWDWQCPLMSLPRAFRTTPDTIPADVPYLAVPGVTAAHWRERLDLAAPGRLRIGIAWAGRKGHRYDDRRSLAFRQLAPLLTDDRVTWVSLQKWTAEEGPPQVPADVDWLDWTDELTDFADTAALVSGLDLVLSIDSSMVHLAGALGRPVWMMNRFDGEWRWFRHRVDSPWYPAMRIFNQPAFGDWDHVVADVRAALADLPVPRPPAPRRVRVAAIPAVTPPPEGLSVDQAIQLAGQYQSAGRLAEAEGLLAQILRAQPRNAHALHLRGVVAWLDGHPDRALALVGEAIAVAPDVALFHGNRTEMCRQQGRLAEAIGHGERAVALDPAMTSAHSNLGIALCDAGEYDRAEACHRRALELAPDFVQSLDNLGSIRHARGDLAGAAAWYRQALAARPDYPESLSNLGAVLVQDDRAAEAEPLLDRALQLQPEYPEALCNLGLARLRLGRSASAIALLRRALQLRPGYHEALVGLARALAGAGRPDEALPLLQEAVDRRGDVADDWYLLGSVCASLGRQAEAAAAWQRTLAIDAGHEAAIAGLGQIGPAR
jgi:tetratricopeptide (TPR) repeat protein